MESISIEAVIGLIASILGIFGVSIVGMINTIRINRRLDAEQARQNSKITVILKATNPVDEIKMPVPIRRSELTRAEVQGMLRILSDGKQFSISFLKDPEYFDNLYKVAGGS